MSRQQASIPVSRGPMGFRGAGDPGRIEKARNSRQAMQRLFRYLLVFRAKLLAVCCLVVVYTLLGLAGPWLMGVAIDRFIMAKNIPGLEKILETQNN